MKVRVVSEFRDKYTDKLCTEGMELEVSEERFVEMESAGRYVEVVEEVQEETEPIAEEPVEESVEEKPSKRGRKNK